MTSRKATRRHGGRRASGRSASDAAAGAHDARRSIRADLTLDADGCLMLPPLFTDPGCDDPRHRLEVQGAMMAMMLGHRWAGETLMDCGCLLSIDTAAATGNAAGADVEPLRDEHGRAD